MKLSLISLQCLDQFVRKQGDRGAGKKGSSTLAMVTKWLNNILLMTCHDVTSNMILKFKTARQRSICQGRGKKNIYIFEIS